MKGYLKGNKTVGIFSVFVLGGVILTVFLVTGFRVTKANPDPGTNIHPTENPLYAPPTLYSNSNYSWGWSDPIGWIDFHSTHNVIVHSEYLEGWASSSIGEIALNCATLPGGSSNCSGPAGNWGVKNNGRGYISGWAWNDAIGWISFAGSSTVWNEIQHATTTIYWNVGVHPSSSTGIDEPPSNFYNYAWNDIVGWISFSCGTPSECLLSGSDYKVATDWFATSTYGTLESAIIDTGIVKGVQINSIIWKGNLPVTTGVSFKLAAATSTSGPWIFLGPNGSISSYYNSYATVFDSPGVYRVKIDNISDFTNKRYFKYLVRLKSDPDQALTPRIDEVTVNWSP